MKCAASLSLCVFFVSFLFTVGHAYGQKEFETAGDVFAKHLAPDQAILEKHPELRKAYEERNKRLGAAMESQAKRLEGLLEREKRKGDLKALTQMENAIKKIEARHAGPCLLHERSSSSIAAILKEWNQEKSRTNKRYLTVAEKEISKTLRNDGIDAAKKIERFLLSSFLPKGLDWSADNAVRFENKIYLLNETPMEWQGAYNWCRERNGDLASITNMNEQVFLYKNIVKERIAATWVGGFKQEGKWYWTDGSPFAYTCWMPGKPSGGNQNRLSFAHDKSGGWDDENEQSFPFIIQWTLY